MQSKAIIGVMATVVFVSACGSDQGDHAEHDTAPAGAELAQDTSRDENAAPADVHAAHDAQADAHAAHGEDGELAAAHGAHAGQGDPHAGHAAAPGEAAAHAGHRQPTAGAHAGHAAGQRTAAAHAGHAQQPAGEHAGHAAPDGQGDPVGTDAGAIAALSLLLAVLLEDPVVRQRVEQDPQLRAALQDPAVQRHITTVRAPDEGMAGLFELISTLLADPGVQTRLQGDPVLRELWADPAVRQQILPRRHH